MKKRLSLLTVLFVLGSALVPAGAAQATGGAGPDDDGPLCWLLAMGCDDDDHDDDHEDEGDDRDDDTPAYLIQGVAVDSSGRRKPDVSAPGVSIRSSTRMTTNPAAQIVKANGNS